MIKRLPIYLLAAVALLAAASAVWGWYHPKTVVREVFVEVEVPKVVMKIERVEIEVEKIVVIEKMALGKTVYLPAAVRDDEDKQVTAVGEVPPHDGKTSVVAVFDTSSGETKLNFRQEPPPFFAFMNDKELGIRYGMGIGGRQVDLYARWTFVRVGAFHLAAYGELNSDEEGLAMIEASYRF